MTRKDGNQAKGYRGPEKRKESGARKRGTGVVEEVGEMRGGGAKMCTLLKYFIMVYNTINKTLNIIIDPSHINKLI